jgi:hypothetical protein
VRGTFQEASRPRSRENPVAVKPDDREAVQGRADAGSRSDHATRYESARIGPAARFAFYPKGAPDVATLRVRMNSRAYGGEPG